MALGVTEIFNMALSAVGQRARVSIPSEETREAEICRRWYDFIRDTLLRSAPWGCARKTDTLALLKARDFNAIWVAGDPEPPWAYVYSIPSDFLYPRYLFGFHKFTMANRLGARVVQTNAEHPVLTYTFLNTDPSTWDQGLIDAVIHGLAAAICMPISAKPQRAQQMVEIANMRALEARQMNANEDDFEIESIPDWLAVRGISSGVYPSRYIYHNGPLLSLPMLSPAPVST